MTTTAMPKNPSVLVLRSSCESHDQQVDTTSSSSSAAADISWSRLQESAIIQCDLLLLPEIPTRTPSSTGNSTNSVQEQRQQLMSQQQVTQIEQLQLNPCGMDNVLLLTDLVTTMTTTTTTTSTTTKTTRSIDYLLSLTSCQMVIPSWRKHHYKSTTKTTSTVLPIEAEPSTFSVSFSPQSPNDSFFYFDTTTSSGNGGPTESTTASLSAELTVAFDVQKARVYHTTTTRSSSSSSSSRRSSDEKQTVKSDGEEEEDRDVFLEPLLLTAPKEQQENSSIPVTTSQGNNETLSYTNQEDLREEDTFVESKIEENTPKTNHPSLTNDNNTPVSSSLPFCNANETWRCDHQHRHHHQDKAFQKQRQRKQHYQSHQKEAILFGELQSMAQREEQFVTTILYGMAVTGIALVVAFLWVLQRVRKQLQLQEQGKVQGQQPSFLTTNVEGASSSIGTLQEQLQEQQQQQLQGTTRETEDIEHAKAVVVLWKDSTEQSTTTPLTKEQRLVVEESEEDPVHAVETKALKETSTVNGNEETKRKAPLEKLVKDPHPFQVQSSTAENIRNDNMVEMNHTLSSEEIKQGENTPNQTVVDTPTNVASSNQSTTVTSESSPLQENKPAVGLDADVPIPIKTVSSFTASLEQSMVRNLFEELVLVTKFVDPIAPSLQQSTETPNDLLQPIRSSPMGGNCNEKRNSEEVSHQVEPLTLKSHEISTKDSAKEDGSIWLQSPETNTKANGSPKQTDMHSNEVDEKRNLSPIEKLASQWAPSSSQLSASTDNSSPKRQNLSNNKTSSDLSPCSKLAKQWEQKKNKRRKKRAAKATITPTGVKVPTPSSSEETAQTPSPPIIHSSPAEPELMLPTHSKPREQERPIPEIPSSICTIDPAAIQAERMQSSRQEKKTNKAKPLFISPFISTVSTDDEEGAARDDYGNALSPASTEVSGDESFLEDYW